MTAAIWTSVIAVLGTLAGGYLNARLRDRSDRQAHLFANQGSAVDSLGDLLEALSNHYAAMWTLESARLAGDEGRITTAYAEHLATRAAVTRPHHVAKLRIPTLADTIDSAVQAVYAMDTATQKTRSGEVLTARRLAAKAAQVELAERAAELLGRLGVGVAVGKV